MSFIYVVGFGDTGRVKVGYSKAGPEKRIEKHKTNARAFLDCDQFEEWISIDHEEGVENEKALIAWCRERTGKVTGEHFTLPYADVVMYAKSLQMTPVVRDAESDAAPLPTPSEVKQRMSMGMSYAAYKGLTEALGEDVMYALEFLINPNYDLPKQEIKRGAFDPETYLNMCEILGSMGLGTTYLDMTAGLAMLRIRANLLERKYQAHKAGRVDLLYGGEEVTKLEVAK